MSINIEIVRSSFELVKPIANQIADRFYEVLFEDFPVARELFTNVDMPKQKGALVGSLVTIVSNLDHPETLTKFLLNLGANHNHYGVEETHYQWVGSSLIKALSQCLGPQWTPEIENQWIELYGIIAEAMKAGSAKSRSKVRLVQGEAPSSANVHTLVKEPLTSFVLPEAAKQHIRNTVQQAFDALVQREVRNCLNEQIERLSKMTTEELIRKVS